jgi:hypothetical protein
MLLEVVEGVGLVTLRAYQGNELKWQASLQLRNAKNAAQDIRKWASYILEKYPSGVVVPPDAVPKTKANNLVSLPIPLEGKVTWIQAISDIDQSYIHQSLNDWIQMGTALKEEPTMEDEGRETMRKELTKELRRLEDEAVLAEVAERDAKTAHLEAKTRVKFMQDLMARLFPETWASTT